MPDVRLADLAADKIRFFVDKVRTAGKVSAFVLAKSDAELLEYSQVLQLRQEERLRSWLDRLLERDIVMARGVKKGTEYLVNPKAYAAANLDVKPSLKTMEPHRLRALIEEDLRAYPDSSIAQIHRRLEELPLLEIRREVYGMAAEGRIIPSPGGTRNRRYSLP